MLSSAVSTERATLQQYNQLRADAYAASWLMPHENVAGANMTVQIEPGRWIKRDSSQVVVASRLTSSTLTAPAANPRYDLLSINDSGALVVTAGSEAGSPAIPSCPVGNLPIGVIYQRVGATSIKDADDSSNSYIIDMRPLMKEVGNPNDYTNVEALSGAKSLTATDAQFQFLDPDGSNRDVNLPTTGSLRDGQMFNIVNEGAENLVVKDDGNTLVTIGEDESAIFVYDLANTEWKVAYSTPPAPVQTTFSKVVYSGVGDSTGVGASTTSTQYFDTHTYTIPANDLVDGVLYEVEGHITYASPDIASNSCGIACRLGTTSIAFVNITIGQSGSSLSGQDIYFKFTVQGSAAAGASVAVYGMGFADARRGSSDNSRTGNAAGSGNVATNGSLLLRISVDPFTNNSGNSFVLNRLVVTKKATSAFPQS